MLEPFILASSPFSLQVMKMWATLPAVFSTAFTAPTLSGLLPERAKETSSTLLFSSKYRPGSVMMSVVAMARTLLLILERAGSRASPM